MALASIHITLSDTSQVSCEHLDYPGSPSGLFMLRLGSLIRDDIRTDVVIGHAALRQLHQVIGDHLAAHDAPATPPIPAEAATDDAESLPLGWRETDCGYEHESGDTVDTTHRSGRAIATLGTGGTLGGFATARDAMEALDAERDDGTAEFDTKDIMSPVPPGIASSYGQGSGAEITEDELTTGRINAPRQVP